MLLPACVAVTTPVPGEVAVKEFPFIVPNPEDELRVTGSPDEALALIVTVLP